MAAPTPPNLATLATEGLKKAGYKSTGANWSTLLTRAEDYWMNEIKNDIYEAEKRLKSLMAIAYQVTTNGLETYSVPSDFGEDMTISTMDGSHLGTVVVCPSTTSITLASDEDIGSQIIGKMILIYAGYSSPQARQCTAYVEATKVATVNADWTLTPNTSSKYMIVDMITELTPVPAWDYDHVGGPTLQGIPTNFVPIGDEDYGEFMLYPTPYRESGIVYGLKIRYYVNLLTLDLAGTLMSTLYHKWRNVWVQGVFAKALSDMDDNRAVQETGIYWNMLRQMVSREKYGNQISDMQCRVGDYD